MSASWRKAEKPRLWWAHHNKGAAVPSGRMSMILAQSHKYFLKVWSAQSSGNLKISKTQPWPALLTTADSSFAAGCLNGSHSTPVSWSVFQYLHSIFLEFLFSNSIFFSLGFLSPFFFSVYFLRFVALFLRLSFCFFLKIYFSASENFTILFMFFFSLKKNKQLLDSI